MWGLRIRLVCDQVSWCLPFPLNCWFLEFSQWPFLKGTFFLSSLLVHIDGRRQNTTCAACCPFLVIWLNFIIINKPLVINWYPQDNTSSIPSVIHLPIIHFLYLRCNWEALPLKASQENNFPLFNLQGDMSCFQNSTRGHYVHTTPVKPLALQLGKQVSQDLKSRGGGGER